MDSTNHHRPGVKGANRVVRHLHLAPCEDAIRAAAISEIDALLGMDEVTFDSDKNRLTIAYDATHLDIDKLVEVLEKHNMKVRKSRWEKMKLGYYEFEDENIKDKEKRPPWKCH